MILRLEKEQYLLDLVSVQMCKKPFMLLMFSFSYTCNLLELSFVKAVLLSFFVFCSD
ncbi:hypothetical protein RchiOBHm_Chr4g0409501 [Rosa chinensis]|uniref:Uncharacterized protein n=1 Tax=Rosa chinensis TaxID=74649 RepID=A0A2P6QV74_ROSCH|nr:hypothetical protein RchiOBHm_Chr4g0409501 [Rosa chinensis]